MQAIRVEIAGRALLFERPRVVRIGRAPDADIVLTGLSTSRAHAELRPTSNGWQIADLGSQHGTHVRGQRIAELLLTTASTVLFGREPDGTLVRFVPLAADIPARLPGSSEQQVGGDRTILPPATTVSRRDTPSGPGLLVRAAGREYSFPPGALVRIGRDLSSDIVCDDPAVSRHHGQLQSRPDGWLYVDSSSTGTYAGANRQASLRVTEPQTLRLGHPVAGAEVVVTPVFPVDVAQRQIRRRRQQRIAGLLSGIVGLAVLIAVVAVIVPRVLDEGTAPGPTNATTPTSTATTSTAPPTASSGPAPAVLTAAELDRAKAATVLLKAFTTNRAGKHVIYTGSGSVIAPGGMILTNAHVAAPQTPGLASRYGPTTLRNPHFLLVSLTRPRDERPADPEYRARLVVADGHIDAAVLQIYAAADGSPLRQAVHLPVVPLGNSDLLRTGDEITILGFPGISDSHALSVTRGVVSTFINDPEIPGPRGEIDTDARIAPGNSGGLAIDDTGRVVGIPSAYRAEPGTPIVSGRVRPINLVKPLIARAAAR